MFKEIMVVAIGIIVGDLILDVIRYFIVYWVYKMKCVFFPKMVII